MDNDRFFEDLSSQTDVRSAPAPSRLKARIYSALMRASAAEGALATLVESRAGGRSLCAWEKLIQITPLPEQAKRWNHCEFCHARLLGEHVEGAPLPWDGCPYAQFQN